jgi:hypothetical protein
MRTLETPHADHSLVSIQYRPLSAPTIDGSELALLKRFKRVGTAEEFYLYFPFFFSDFGGFREVRDANLPLLLGSMESAPNADPQVIHQIRETFEGSVDAFIRAFGQGDFRPIFDQIQPMVDDRTRQAHMSQQLYELYQRLRELAENFKVVYKGEDISHQDDPGLHLFISPESTHTSDPRWSYVLYSLGLELPILNDKVDMDNLIPVLLQRIQANDHEEHLDPDIRMLHAFGAICRDSEGFSDYINHMTGGTVELPKAHIIASLSWDHWHDPKLNMT